MRPPRGNTTDAQESEDVSTKQRRIAAIARERPEMVFTSLAHLIDLDWLSEAYARTRKDGAVGVDGQTAADYEQDLEETSGVSWSERSQEPTRPHRYAASTFPKGTGRPAPWGYRPSKTKCFNGRLS